MEITTTPTGSHHQQLKTNSKEKLKRLGEWEKKRSSLSSRATGKEVRPGPSKEVERHPQYPKMNSNPTQGPFVSLMKTQTRICVWLSFGLSLLGESMAQSFSPPPSKRSDVLKEEEERRGKETNDIFCKKQC